MEVPGASERSQGSWASGGPHQAWAGRGMQHRALRRRWSSPCGVGMLPRAPGRPGQVVEAGAGGLSVKRLPGASCLAGGPLHLGGIPTPRGSPGRGSGSSGWRAPRPCTGVRRSYGEVVGSGRSVRAAGSRSPDSSAHGGCSCHGRVALCIYQAPGRCRTDVIRLPEGSRILGAGRPPSGGQDAPRGLDGWWWGRARCRGGGWRFSRSGGVIGGMGGQGVSVAFSFVAGRIMSVYSWGSLGTREPLVTNAGTITGAVSPGSAPVEYALRKISGTG